MTDFKKIFLDTSPIVYYLERNKSYYPKMKMFWKEYENCDYITSAVTVTEQKKQPKKQRKSDQNTNILKQWMPYNLQQLI